MSDTVIIAIVAAVAPTLAVLLAYLAQRRKAAVVESKVDAVHELANNRLTEALAKIETLTAIVATLRERGGTT